MDSLKEKDIQERYPWERSAYYSEYNSILGYYQVESCLEYVHGESLLDLPCGDGTLTALFARYFKRVVGVDASSKHIEVARQRMPQAEFHECLIEEYTSGELFDNVVMLNILEHVVDPLSVLRKAGSLLKRGGKLIVQVPNANAINRHIAVRMGTLKSLDELSPFDINVAGHRRSYMLQSLQKDIVDAGFNVVATGGIFYKMLSTAQMDWFLNNGLWQDGGFGWGRLGEEISKDWKSEFCRACYEIGKDRPEDCNVIYAVALK
ncbi:MAG: class I SAM-dependent methyltransferase [Desulfobacterales bacterium]|nr:class I SAM-dependent methyltransferase [Desulfobacterales bacterium]